MSDSIKFVVLMLLMLPGCGELRSVSLPDPTVSRLIDEAEQFDGKEVEIAGLLRVGPESRQLWTTRDAYDRPTTLVANV